MDLSHMPNHITFAVVGVTAIGAMVGFYLGLNVEFEMPDEIQSTLEDLVTVQTLEVELVVETHVVLIPVLVSE